MQSPAATMRGLGKSGIWFVNENYPIEIAVSARPLLRTFTKHIVVVERLTKWDKFFFTIPQMAKKKLTSHCYES